MHELRRFLSSLYYLLPERSARARAELAVKRPSAGCRAGADEPVMGSVAWPGYFYFPRFPSLIWRARFADRMPDHRCARRTRMPIKGG